MNTLANNKVYLGLIIDGYSLGNNLIELSKSELKTWQITHRTIISADADYRQYSRDLKVLGHFGSITRNLEKYEAEMLSEGDLHGMLSGNLVAILQLTGQLKTLRKKSNTHVALLSFSNDDEALGVKIDFIHKENFIPDTNKAETLAS